MVSVTLSMITMAKGYPSSQPISGMNLKFIPYTPAIKVSGTKKREIMVRVFMIELVLLLRFDMYMSIIDAMVSAELS